MLYVLNDFLIVIFEVICCKLLYSTFTVEENEHPTKIQNVSLIVLMSVVMFIIVKLLSSHLLIKQIAVIITITFIMKLFHGYTWVKTVVLACIYQGLLVTVEYLAYFIVQILVRDIDEMNSEQEMFGRLVAALDLLLLFTITLIIKRRFQKHTNWMLRDYEWIRFVIFPIYSILVISEIIKSFTDIENNRQINVLYMLTFGLVLMNFFVFYILDDTVKKSEMIHEREIYATLSKNQLEMYNLLTNNLNRHKLKSHEFYNHILCIYSLIKNEEIYELDKYVSNLCDGYMQEEDAINTNNIIINNIINIKYAEAISKNIVFVMRVNDLSQITIKNEDLVVMISNLLDNAIEACGKCHDKRVIKLKFIIENNDIILSVKNTYNQPILRRGETFLTSKQKNKDEHGFGIKNIIRVVNKYNGTYVIQNDNHEFMFSIMIPLNE